MESPSNLSLCQGTQQVLPGGAWSSVPSHSNTGRALSSFSALCLELCRVKEKINGHLLPGPAFPTGDGLWDGAEGALKLCTTAPEELTAPRVVQL